jgi:hypothetical protein
VHKVCLRGPFVILRQHDLSLLDIPGEGDSDPLMHRHFERGIKLCSNIYYLPLYQQAGNQTTMEGAMRFMDCPRASILFTHSGNLLQSKEIRNKYPSELEPYYRNQLQKKAEKYGDAVREFIRRIPMHFVDNINSRELFHENWLTFLSSMTSVLDQESATAVVEFVNNINDAFALLRTNCNISAQQRDSCVILINNCIELCQPSQVVPILNTCECNLRFPLSEVNLLPSSVSNHLVLNTYFCGRNRAYPAQALVNYLVGTLQYAEHVEKIVITAVINARKRLLD